MTDETKVSSPQQIGESPRRRFDARISANLFRSLQRLSLAIEQCAQIGFEESSPTRNASHAAIWNDLNDAQADAKLKLKHYAAEVWQGQTEEL